MSVADVFLRLQRGLDRLARRLRPGPAPRRDGRRLLIVQIDGLSRGVLEQALAGVPPSVTHPRQLYPHFLRYREAA